MKTNHGKGLLLAVGADIEEEERSNREAHGEEVEVLLLRVVVL